MTKNAPQDKLIVILGPTATGKTKLAVRIAQELRTSVVSGDSMLVYRGLDIGSAKPDEAERGGVHHALIDCLDPAVESFNAAEFQRLAAEEIHSVNQGGSIPILVGGTGLYVKALLEGYRFNKDQEDDEFRASLENLAEKRGKAYVHKMLEKVDPKLAAKLHVNDFRRVVRALEVWHLGKERISQEKQNGGLVYDACVIGLRADRKILYERIERRVDAMIAAGLEDEVRRLLASGVARSAHAMQGIGYKEMLACIDGKLSLAEAGANIKKATRHFAKRQFTWYRKMPYIHWFDIDAVSLENLVKTVLEAINNKFM
ncbi:MAG TPA: tRNA (adenosine(37)-N6)-dimethylallyltransferase MiaA [Spirochaetaceae bacterium]|nr:tRNA (adenosine(37)-N6)-dimethylallyltransferase MiaA [Spirochaetaceae bacterium]